MFRFARQTVKIILFTVVVLAGSALGQSYSCQSNTVLYVGGPVACWTGTDIGAQINTAYASLSAQGGTIFILPQPGGGCYSYTTPIVLNTSGKYATLAGTTSASPTPSGGACINFTTTTNTCATGGNAQGGSSPCNAVVLDYTPTAGGGYLPGNGLRDLTLVNNNCETNGGCASTATGVLTGTTNGGAHMAMFQNVRISGFATGINLDDAGGIGWGMQFENFSLVWNTTGMELTTTHENTHWFGGSLAVNGTGIDIPTASDVFLSGVSIDGQTVVGVTGGGNFVCASCHFENLSQTNAQYITSSGNVTLTDGVMLDDNASGTVAQFITMTSGFVNIKGLTVYSGGQTITNLVNNSSGGVGYVDFSTQSSSSLVPGTCSVPLNCLGPGRIAGVNPSMYMPVAIAGTVQQTAAKSFAGSCSMSSGTTCTFTLGSAFTAYLCFAAIDHSSTPPAAAISAKCSLSGSTATITAGATNSLTWDALFIGNPN
jgi:hypothetical protein